MKHLFITKYHFKSISLFLSLFLIACEEEKIRFIDSQPIMVNADLKIREKFQGKYFCERDSTVMIISENQIIQKPLDLKLFIKNDGKNEGSPKPLDGKIVFDSTFNIKFKMHYSSSTDSVEMEGGAEWRIFDMKAGGVAKYFKNYYFLNIPEREKGGYKVRLLNLTTDGLIYSKIGSDSLLHLLENEHFIIKEKTEEGEENWKLQPSRNELKKLIKMGLFSEIQEYKRIK